MANTTVKKRPMRAVMNEPEAIQFINKELGDPQITKAELSRRVCKKFSFIAPNGTPQLTSCLAVLASLNEKNKILLPLRKKALPRKKRTMVRLGNDVPLPPEGLMPASAEGLGNELEIILLGDDDSNLKIIWNELMVTEHPQGDKFLPGYQMKYLVIYKGYYIGGFAFNSSSFHLEARDKWIGWTKSEQEIDRQSVLCMSRFLIRNAIHCSNLASKLLSMILKRIEHDFKDRYHIDLWLVESFADISSYKGTCYKASNWIYLGTTKGRGRNDTKHKNNAGVKDIYVYPIGEKFRKKPAPEIEQIPVFSYEPKSIEEGLSSDEWVKEEFERCQFKRESHKDCLLEILEHKITSPSSSYPAVANGDRRLLNGYYKFLGGYSRALPLKDGETEKKRTPSIIHFDDILKGHRDSTICRMASYDKVLVIQDSCDLNYNNLRETEGLGIIGRNNKSNAGTRGARLHSSFTVTKEGLPLGITKSQVDSSDLYSDKERAERTKLPFEEKGSYKWYLHYLDTIAIANLIDNTQMVSVMDREGDIWEIFEKAVDNKERAPVLIRAKQNRVLAEESPDGKSLKLFQKMEDTQKAFTVEMNIPEQRARHESTKKEARPYIPPRVAQLSVRYGEVNLSAPANKKDPEKKSLKINFIYVTEDDAPAGVEDISWRLLTTLDIKDNDDALDGISHYKERWKVEDWHRVLKSSCKIEKHKQDDIKSLTNIIAIDLVIGWRIMLLTLLGRECPELPAEVVFGKYELLAMSLIEKKR